VLAEIAFIGHAGYRIPVPGTIGTGRDAVATADALSRVNGDKAVFLLKGCSDRASRHARGFVTLHALTRLKLGSSAFEPACVHDPVSPETLWNIVFNLARDHARLAVKALESVNDDGISLGFILFHH
jgi:hypothetical protein